MPNLASLLSDRIRRLARREIRGPDPQDPAAHGPAPARHRRAQASGGRPRPDRSLPGEAGAAPGRKPASGAARGQRSAVLRAKRQGPARPSRPFGEGLWQARGRAALTSYSWESGKSRPRARQLAGLAAPEAASFGLAIRFASFNLPARLAAFDLLGLPTFFAMPITWS